jgi:hypothetical protein
MNPEDFLIVSMPTPYYDVKLPSVTALETAAYHLGRKLYWNAIVGGPLILARNMEIKSLKDFSEKNGWTRSWLWSFHLDSDVLIKEDQGLRIAQLILKAEEMGYSFTSEYSLVAQDANGVMFHSVFKNYEENYSRKELAAAKDFELKVYYSGLGLCYLKTPLEYTFRFDNRGEDFHFFEDQQLDLRYARIDNVHYKTVPLSNDTVIKYEPQG